MASFSRSLGNDLDAAQRRRLWIVGQVLGGGGTHGSPADAFELALGLERFISSGLDCGERDRSENGPHAPRSGDRSGLLSRPAPAVSTQAVSTQASVAPASPQPSRDDAGRGRSDVRQSVAGGPVPGTADGSLAVRLAHSLAAGQAGKLHLTRRPQGRPGSAVSSQRHLSRDEELALQQQFLRQRAPSPYTVEDVIRFLRQRGDSVVTHDAGYLVNERLVLTRDQLITRANRKRKHIGAPLFAIANGVAAAPDPVSQSFMMNG
jgi:hypothetical protein